MSDALFVSEIPAAQALVKAVRTDDHDTIRDILTSRTDGQLWALLLDLAAMVTADDPDPERVLTYCCDVETRLTFSARPDLWSAEDLHDAVCVARARTAPDAAWVARGVAEWRRRREQRDALIADLNTQALAVREAEKRGKRAGRHLVVAS